MPSRIRLTITEGPLTGATFDYTGRDTVLVGRGLDANVRLPDDHAHRTISRNHCLLDLNPPDIRIRDFGSLNGTWVNGEKIGQRHAHTPAGEASVTEFPEFDLHDGDKVALGGTVFTVSVTTPGYCAVCNAEIPAEKKERLRINGVPLCERHYGEQTTRRREEGAPSTADLPAGAVCARCGKDVTGEIGEGRHGDFVCAACRVDPLDIVNRLMEEADRKKPSALAVRGYQIERELGRGGMGAVYLAVHEETGQKVALKVMLPAVASDESARNMFIREVENTRALVHPNIVRLLESGYADGVFYFTLEFCDGGSVDRLMERMGGKVPPRQAVELTLQVLDGLAYAHTVPLTSAAADGATRSATGMVHRDIKPANIFLTHDGDRLVAKVADMGLGKAFDMAGLSGQTRTGSVIGTPFFMPRQQVINFKYARPDVDVWSAAASLYNMLTGKLARKFLKGRDPWQVVLQSPAVPIREREPSIPAPLAEVIDRALIDNPDILFKRAADLRDALASLLPTL